MQYNDTSSIKTLYHWARSPEVRDHVLANGISPDRLGFIYLSEKPLHLDRGYVFKVSIPDNSFLFDWREFWQDNSEGKEYDPSNPYYVYVDHPIPAKFVELVPGSSETAGSAAPAPFSHLVDVYHRGL